MRKTPLMLRVEARLGEPLEVGIPRLYAEGLGFGGIASRLGVSRYTLELWRAALGLEVRLTLVPRTRSPDG